MAVDVARPQGTTRGGPPPGGSPAESGSKLSRFVSFVKEAFHEVRYKTTWPDLTQVRSASIAIIVFVLVLALIITLVDMALQGLLVKLIPSLFAGR